MPVTNEGLVRDSLLKMVHNPGGDWHPGWGVDLSYMDHESSWLLKVQMDPEIS